MTTIRPRRGDLEAAAQRHPFRPSGEYAGRAEAEVCDLCGLAQQGKDTIHDFDWKPAIDAYFAEALRDS